MSTLKFNRWQSTDGVTRNAVLQVVSNTIDTYQQITSVSFVDTPLTLSITPTSATSKILVLINMNYYVKRDSTSNLIAVRLKRDSTTIYAPYTTNATGNFGSGGSSAAGITSITTYDLMPIQYLDAPATTNQVTYTLQGCLYVNTGSASLNINFSSTTGSQTSTVTLMEIAQ